MTGFLTYGDCCFDTSRDWFEFTGPSGLRWILCFFTDYGVKSLNSVYIIACLSAFGLATTFFFIDFDCFTCCRYFECFCANSTKTFSVSLRSSGYPKKSLILLTAFWNSSVCSKTTDFA